MSPRRSGRTESGNRIALGVLERLFEREGADRHGTQKQLRAIRRTTPLRRYSSLRCVAGRAAANSARLSPLDARHGIEFVISSHHRPRVAGGRHRPVVGLNMLAGAGIAMSLLRIGGDGPLMALLRHGEMGEQGPLSARKRIWTRGLGPSFGTDSRRRRRRRSRRGCVASPGEHLCARLADIGATP